MRFCSEGDCAISPPRCPRRWLPEGPVPQSPPASMYGSTGSLIRRVVGPGPRGRDLGRVTAPCTPLRGPPSPRMAPSRWGPSSPTGQPPPGAQSSVVIFRFVEKASVRPLNGLPASGGLSRSWDLGGVSPPRPAPALGPGCNRKLRLEASTSDPLPAGGGSALPGSRDPSRGPLVPPQIGADGLYSSLPNGLGGTPEHLAMHFRGPADTGFLNQVCNLPWALWGLSTPEKGQSSAPVGLRLVSYSPKSFNVLNQLSRPLLLCSRTFILSHVVFFLLLHILCPCMSGFHFGVLCLSLPLWLRGTPGPPPGKSPLTLRESLEPNGNSSMAPWTPPAQVRLGISLGEVGRAFSTPTEDWQRVILQTFFRASLGSPVSQSLSGLQAFIYSSTP